MVSRRARSPLPIAPRPRCSCARRMRSTSSSRRRDPLVPPRRLQFVGEGDFVDHRRRVPGASVALGELRPDERVLDVGCGIGRIARPLAGYLSRRRHLRRVRRRPRGIDWCRARLPRPPRLRLRASRRLQRALQPRRLAGPARCASRTTTRASTWSSCSVFTHLLPDGGRALPARGAPGAHARRAPVRHGLPARRISRRAVEAGTAALSFGPSDGRHAVVDRTCPRRLSPTTRSGSWTASPTPDSRPPGSATGRGRGAMRDGLPGHRGGAPVSAGPQLIDVRHLGREQVICCMRQDDGVLIDPGPGSSIQTLLEALGDDRAARDPADPHPPRPRGRDGRARAPLARRRGLGPRARRAAPRRPVAAASPARRGSTATTWSGCGARSCRSRRRNLRVLERRRDDRRLRASPTRPATPRTTSPTSTSRPARRSPATWPACASRGGPGARRRRRRPTSTSRRGAHSIDDRRAPGARAPGADALRRVRGRRRASRRAAGGHRAVGRARAPHGRRGVRRGDRADSPRRDADGRSRRRCSGDAAGHPVAGPRPLLVEREAGRFRLR